MNEGVWEMRCGLVLQANDATEKRELFRGVDRQGALTRGKDRERWLRERKASGIASYDD